MILRPVLAGVAMVLHSGIAAACGYCVEDKIASTYDHAVLVRALGQKHAVAFFHIDGSLAPGEATRRWLETETESASGVDRGSVRVSADTATLSFAFDPKASPLARIQAAVERKFTTRKLSLMPLRVMDRPAELKTVAVKPR